MNEFEPDAFDRFPRARLALRWSRRQWLAALATERSVAASHTQGGASFKVPDLGTLPDDLVELLTPVMTAGTRLHEDDRSWWAFRPGLGPRIRVCSTSSAAARALVRFDGATPLGVIASALATEQGWGRAYALAYVRGLFLHLVSWGLCLPQR